MNFASWYTDTMDIRRVQTVMDGSLTRQERVQVAAGIPCRIYHSDSKAIGMAQTAANIRQEDKLACAIEVDVQAGDELIIHRGGRLGRPGPTVRAFAADPNLYYEPVGSVSLGLAHQEVRLLQQEIVKGGVKDELHSEPPAENPAAEKSQG